MKITVSSEYADFEMEVSCSVSLVNCESCHEDAFANFDLDDALSAIAPNLLNQISKQIAAELLAKRVSSKFPKNGTKQKYSSDSLAHFMNQASPEQRRCLARSCGTSVPYLYQLAGGHRTPSLKMARKIQDQTQGKVQVSSFFSDSSANNV